MIGVITRSNSCSGTCLNFRTARQPNTSALEKAEGAGGRATICRVGRSGRRRCPSCRFLRRGRRPPPPVSAKKTSSRLGLPIEKSASSMPAGDERAERLVRRLRRSGHDRERRRLPRCAGRGRRGAPRAAARLRRAGRDRRARHAGSRSRWRPSARGCVPSAIFLPWSMTAMRAASWSASSRYCVVSRIVTPASASARIMRHTPWRAIGSSPVVGSSRNSTPGVTISEAAMSSRRRMPPE